jgi:hypothetical protein
LKEEGGGGGKVEEDNKGLKEEGMNKKRQAKVGGEDREQLGLIWRRLVDAQITLSEALRCNVMSTIFEISD